MRHEPVSQRRRQVMVAGLAGIAAPAVLAAGPGEQAAEPSAAAGMIVSGRILGTDGRPLACARIDAWDPEGSGDRATAIADADGRFFATLPAARRRLEYRIGHTKLGALPARREALAHLHRDEAGVWRASLGITLA